MLDNHNSTLLSNIVMDSIRILILVSKFQGSKKFKLTMDKIILYDYYMKFPSTMIENKNLNIDLKYDFFEYYSYYHWKPDVVNYRRVIQYLISKGLILRELENKQFHYNITEKGLAVISQLSSNYKNALVVISDYIKLNISKKKDSEVEQEILEKTSIINRFEGGVDI